MLKYDILFATHFVQDKGFFFFLQLFFALLQTALYQNKSNLNKNLSYVLYHNFYCTLYSCFHEVSSCTALTTSRVYVLTRCSRLCLNFNLSFNPDNNMALGFYLLRTKDHLFFLPALKAIICLCYFEIAQQMV